MKSFLNAIKLSAYERILNKDFFQKRIAQGVQQGVTSLLNEYGYLRIAETKEHDVFIVGYPKSGNTWVQFMMACIVSGIDPSHINLSVVLEFVPDVHYKKIYKRYNEVCFFKSHDLPKKKHKKVIYLVRDGRDAMISYYHMNKIQFTDYSKNDMIINGKGLFPGKWHEHVHEWVKNPFGSQMIVVRYEDLKKDTFGELRRICNFCNLNVSVERLNSVIEGCSFEKLKSLEINNGLQDGSFAWKGTQEKRFFRKGEVGNFKDELSPELIQYFVNEAQEELALFNYR